MAANLTPQYLKAQEAYRRATTAEEQLRWLEVMFQEIPKHKASEKLQSDLKTKISRVKKEADADDPDQHADHAPIERREIPTSRRGTDRPRRCPTAWYR